MGDLQIFNNEEFGEIRTVEIEGKLFFCGKDVAGALGYAIPKDAIAAHCKGAVKHRTPTNGGVQELLFIPEGDLYRLIVSSKLATAEKFEHWVFDEVLPSIRKHGLYATDELLDNPDLIIQMATKLKEERKVRKLLELENKVQSQQIAELQPKASYYDLILQCKDLLTVTEISKDYGMSAKGLNTKLHELGVQYRQSSIWFLYSKYQDKGYTQTKTQSYTKSDGTIGSSVHTYWTQKGRLFLYNLLKENSILPMIEKEDA